VVSQDWLTDDSALLFPQQTPLFQFAQEQWVGLHAPKGSVEIPDPEPNSAAHTLTWTEQNARSFRYDLIFKGIANADHARSPAITSRVFFIEPPKGVILHMYDDRGLDLIAKGKEALEGIYHTFHAWILDYDRPRISQIFRSDPPAFTR
jgi:hypothetical protein